MISVLEIMISVVSVPPHAVRTYLVSRDIALNRFYPTWRVFTDYLTLATRTADYEKKTKAREEENRRNPRLRPRST